MKQFLIFPVIFFAVVATLAQAPANDNCEAPLNLGTAPVCTGDVYSSVGATPSDIGSNNIPSCFSGGAPLRDVWFTFVCPANPVDFRIGLAGAGGTPVKNPQLAVYRGDCTPDGLAELACVQAAPGETELFLDVEALTPGAVYFLRVADYSPTGTPNSGAFTLCINEIPPILSIDQGGSSLCSGTLYDTGGPNGDYGPNEDHTFTICPGSNPGCITFTLEYYSLDAGPAVLPGNPGFDLLSFYDGPDVFSPALAQINGFSTITGADGGGGVCFQVQAGSGCLTVQFQSDFATQFEGFKGNWSCSKSPCEPKAPIDVESAVTPVDIADAITAPGAKVDSIKIDCKYGAYGTFSFATDNNDLGLKKGLVLSSGSIHLVPGPNNAEDATQDNNFHGDANLNYLSTLLGSNTLSLDACVVELDVFVATDELTFEYVFGSEEYPEYVGNVYNDIFAFLASGPGIAGDPNMNGARNIALLPNSTIPVQINSVNNLMNWQYFRNNEVSLGSTLQYDGLTADQLGIKKSLTARVGVLPCNSYHLKLAVADRHDPFYDSGVFIAEVKGGSPQLSAQFASGLDYLIENCSGNLDKIAVKLTKPKSVAASYVVSVGGTATAGLDYLLDLPDTLTFQPGDTVFYFPIIPLADGLTEGPETITISISQDFGCGNVVFQSVTLTLQDQAEVMINGGADTLFVCTGGTVDLQASGAENYFWAPPLAVSDPGIPDPSITPAKSMWVYVSGSVGDCTNSDSVYIQVIGAPTLSVQPGSPVNICQGDSVQLFALTNAPTADLQWTPKTRLSDASSRSPLAFPLADLTYTATLSVAGCPVKSASVVINVDTLFFPTLIQSDTICQNTALLLANALNTTTKYQWTPPDGLTAPWSSGPLATPMQTTTYVLTATSAHGYCTRKDSVTLTVKPADLDILGPDTLEICLPDTVMLQATTAPAGSPVAWSPGAYADPLTGPFTRVAPLESTAIVASYSHDGCPAFDSVYIRVDSLPDAAIYLEPPQSLYCPGDTILLWSPTYYPPDFPGLAHEWIKFGGELYDEHQWSQVIVASVSHTFQRIDSIHACVDTASIYVQVGVLPALDLNVSAPEICPGDTVHFTLTVSPDQEVEWDDPSGTLSCNNCKSLFATPSFTTAYSVSTPKADCPADTSIQIAVLHQPALDLTPKTICFGDSIRLNDIPTDPSDHYVWHVLPPGAANSIADTLDPHPWVKPDTSTTYRVAANGLYCQNAGAITVTVSRAGIDAGSDQTICFGTPVTLTAVSDGVAGTVTWTPGANLNDAIVTVTPADTTLFTATLDFPPACRVSDSMTVYVTPPLNLGPLTAEPSTDPVCEGSTLRLKLGMAPSNATLAWFENGEPIPGATSDSISVSPAGTEDGVAVLYSVVATDSFGCVAGAGPLALRVKRCYVIPNAFTPGNDGNNDTFGGIQLLGGALEVLEFNVYNRWGQRVFEATTAQPAWDGRVDGKDAPADVYVYFVKVRFANGDEKTFKGDVSLLR